MEIPVRIRGLPIRFIELRIDDPIAFFIRGARGVFDFGARTRGLGLRGA
jgi:hypothetical protein